MAKAPDEFDVWVNKEDVPLLSIDEQIAQLKEKGVTFDLCSEEEARAYLADRTYYFKIRSFRTLFDKRIGGKRDGQYVNLDFGHLRALASLDRDLRYALLPLTLDVEHAARTKLIRNITENPAEDGYAVCADYMASLNHDERNRRKRDVGMLAKDIYCSGLLEKYGKDPAKIPAWVLLELFSFGSFIDLYRFCAKRWEDSDMEDEHYLLRQAKSVRNACAHSSNVVNGFRFVPEVAESADEEDEDGIATNDSVGQALAKTGLSHRVRTSKMKNPRLKQIVTLMYLHTTLVTEGTGRSRSVAEMQRLKDKMTDSLEILSGNDIVRSSLYFLITVIDKWFA